MKLNVGDLIEIHGSIVSVQGTYRVKSIGTESGLGIYSFTLPKGKKVKFRHWVDSIDPWVTDANNPNLNKIVKL